MKRALQFFQSIPERIKRIYSDFQNDPVLRKKYIRNFLRSILFSLATGVAIIVLLFFSVWVGLFGKLPSNKDLAAIENQLSSEIYSDNGTLLGKYFIYDRSHATREQISENVINALIATEDVRFYNHNGIDYQSLARVFFKSILLGQRSAGGGSTLSQQLAKNLFSRNGGGILSLPVSKIREMIVARRLEKIYSKNEILVLYLNTVPFGENVYGISAASLRFFNKNPRDLTIEEAAVLVGMLKATTFFNPRTQPERAIQRRNVVIGQLARYDYISRSKADSLAALPITINYNPMTHNQGPAPYFREMVRKQVVRILDEYNTRNGTDYNLYTHGLKIHTSIDYDLQYLAEAALRSQLSRQQKTMDNYYSRANREQSRRLIASLAPGSDRYKAMQKQRQSDKDIMESFQKKQPMDLFSWDGPVRKEITPLDSIFLAQQIMHAAIVSIDPANGQVKAWVGGNDFRHFQFDHVMAQRQAGSAFKPFLYHTALQLGIDPCEYVSNEQRVYENYDNWSPANSTNNYDGYYSMTGALAMSINTVSAHYISMTGILPVIETAKKAGIKSQLPPVPSLALGTANVNLLELTNGYATIARNGNYIEPVWLLRIEDKNGRVIYQNQGQGFQQEVLPYESSVLTRRMLQAVTENGTASSLRHTHGLSGDLAGKTGTTQNNADTWFIGFTPGLVTGVWTGLENPSFAAIHGAPLGSGGSAVPLWGDYHRRISRSPALRKYTSGSFTPIDDSLLLAINCTMYLDELPVQNWWENIFEPTERQRDRRRQQPEERPGSRLRRWLENIFGD